jgi:cobalamin biosynthesis Mg chelatase CobN
VNATTTTTSTAVRRATAGAVLSVAAILTAAPAYAAPAPEAPVADSSSQHSKAAIERAERTHGTYRTSDPSSVPVTVLALIGGTLVAGAAGYTVYRFRHHGPVGAATA